MIKLRNHNASTLFLIDFIDSNGDLSVWFRIWTDHSTMDAKENCFAVLMLVFSLSISAFVILVTKKVFKLSIIFFSNTFLIMSDWKQNQASYRARSPIHAHNMRILFFKYRRKHPFLILCTCINASDKHVLLTKLSRCYVTKLQWKLYRQAMVLKWFNDCRRSTWDFSWRFVYLCNSVYKYFAVHTCIL